MVTDELDLNDFLPYLLNRAAEVSSVRFAEVYKGKYGMLRTEWRVLIHLGQFGALTASEICARAGLHKTKVSRAVAALEAKRFLQRNPQEEDRRRELLVLTPRGSGVYRDLGQEALQHDAKLRQALGPELAEALPKALRLLMDS